MASISLTQFSVEEREIIMILLMIANAQSLIETLLNLSSAVSSVFIFIDILFFAAIFSCLIFEK